MSQILHGVFSQATTWTIHFTRKNISKNDHLPLTVRWVMLETVPYLLLAVHVKLPESSENTSAITKVQISSAANQSNIIIVHSTYVKPTQKCLAHTTAVFKKNSHHCSAWFSFTNVNCIGSFHIKWQPAAMGSSWYSIHTNFNICNINENKQVLATFRKL